MTKVFYKYCKVCYQYFQAELMSIQIYCDNCKNKEYIPGLTNQQRYIRNIKHSRSISLDHFDIYDLERPLKNERGVIIDYERVCRVCGAALRTKKGKYSYHKRYCGTKECNGEILFSKFNWGAARFKYIKKLHEKQEKEIETELIKRNINIERKYHFLFCEKCNKLCKLNADFRPFSVGYRLEHIEVHHKTPVYTLTAENILLIFDLNNLICLCESCHNNTKGIKKPKGPVVKFITMERFL